MQIRATAINESSPIPAGREADLRDLLAMLEHDRVVAVVGFTGIGKSTLLQAVADHHGVYRFEGEFPERIEADTVLVVDNAGLLGRRTLRTLMRRVEKVGARLLVSTSSTSLLPIGFRIHRVYGLPLEAAAGQLEGVPGQSPESVAAMVGGHPELLAVARELLESESPPEELEALRAAMGDRVRARYCDPLPKHARRVAALLAASGGWLPAELDVPRFEEAVEVLLDEGLVETWKGFVEASPVLPVVFRETPTRKDLEVALEAVLEAARTSPTWSRLAETYLLHALRREDEALDTLRAALRLSRGALRSVSFVRSLANLALDEATELAALARLGTLFHRYGNLNCAHIAIPRVEALLEAGALAPQDAREARTFLAFMALETDGLERALSGLNRCAEDAAEAGDIYAEAQALLWETWVHVLADHHEVARHIGEETVRKGRKARAPAVVERALFAVARADHALGRFDRAESRLEQALRLTRRHRLDDDEVIVLDGLAETALAQGRPSEAAGHLERADAIVARAENLARKGDLAIGRGAVALRRGHVDEARRVLSGAELELATEDWTRDLLRAEAALAAADFEEARRILEGGVPHPAASRAWYRRRAVVASALLREGYDVRADFSGAGQDEVVDLLLARNDGDFARTLARIEVLERSPSDEWAVMAVVYREALALRMLQGRLDEAMEYARKLRGFFSRTAAPTAVILFLEAVEAVARGELEVAVLKGAQAHRVARALGHRRLEEGALVLLGGCQIALGRKHGACLVLRRAERMGKSNPSPAWASRRAMLRVLMSLRFGGRAESSDLKVAAGGPDLLASAVARRLRGEEEGGAFDAAIQWLEDRLLGGRVPVVAAAPVAEPAIADESVEVTLDGERREVVFAGGKRVAFGRRRVLWRVLWYLYEAQGGVVDPEILYTACWQLPFNQSRLNSLYVGIRRLRLLVEPDPSAPRVIVVGGNGGYRMDPHRVTATGPSPLADLREG